MSLFPAAALAAGFSPDKQTYITNSAAENLDQYRPGGFHPIELNSIISTRYKILHKLGFGSFSTVWLAQDLDPPHPLVSLKISTSSPTSVYEPHLLQHLHRSKSDPRTYTPGARFVLDIKNHLTLHGQNGSHPVIVTEFLGPSISAAKEDLDSPISPTVAKRLAKQTAQGVAFLHSADVAHGDLHLGNLLLYHPSFAHWEEEDIASRLGKPEVYPIVRHDGKEVTPWAPAYEVAAVNHVGVLPMLDLEGSGEGVEVRIVDFGEAYVGKKGRRPGVPVAYAAPEVLRMSEEEGGEGREVGLQADVWTLGVTLFELLTERMLFPGCGVDGGKVLGEIEGALGLGGGLGTRVVGMEERLMALDVLGEEAQSVKNVFRKMFKIDPMERCSAREVVEMLPAEW